MLEFKTKDYDPSEFLSKLIFVNGEYSDYLTKKKLTEEEIILCPTDAIDSNKNKIDSDKCVECLLCAHACSNSMIMFGEETLSFRKFLEYCKTDKKFLTRWIGLTISIIDKNVTTGYEVKVVGGSREKRIPLLLITKDKPFLVKVVDNYKDLERGILLLNDINELIIESGHKPASVIIVPKESTGGLNLRTKKSIIALHQKYKFNLLSLDSLWNFSKNRLENKPSDWKRLFNAI